MAAEFAAPGGTTQALIDALRERLRVCLQDLLLPTDVEGEAPRAPDIVDGYLPPKRSKGKRGEFPFVIVRAISGDDAAQDAGAVRVRMVIGVWSESEAGYRDWMAVKERIRIDLLGQQVLDDRFRLQYPFNWYLPDEQALPQWEGVLEVGWTVPGIIDNTWGVEIL